MSKLHISPAQISFNDTASSTTYKTHTLTIVNSQDAPIGIALSNIPSQSIQSYANTSSFIPTEPVIKNGSVAVDLDFSSSTVNVPANSQMEVTVRVVLPDPRSLTYHYQMYGGFIGLTHVDTQQRLATVPYFGVLGRMIDVPVFDRGFPYLAVSKASDAKLDPTDSYVYDMKRRVSTKPAVVIRLLSGTAQMNIDVYRANGTLMGAMDGGPWVYNQRNKLSQENYDTSIAWNGKVVASDKTTQVPDGDYYIQLRALKHFGSVDNAMDWQEWKSGSIQVKSWSEFSIFHVSCIDDKVLSPFPEEIKDPHHAAWIQFLPSFFLIINKTWRYPYYPLLYSSACRVFMQHQNSSNRMPIWLPSWAIPSSSQMRWAT